MSSRLGLLPRPRSWTLLRKALGLFVRSPSGQLCTPRTTSRHQPRHRSGFPLPLSHLLGRRVRFCFAPFSFAPNAQHLCSSSCGLSRASLANLHKLPKKVSLLKTQLPAAGTGPVRGRSVPPRRTPDAFLGEPLPASRIAPSSKATLSAQVRDPAPPGAASARGGARGSPRAVPGGATRGRCRTRNARDRAHAAGSGHGVPPAPSRASAPEGSAGNEPAPPGAERTPRAPLTSLKNFRRLALGVLLSSRLGLAAAASGPLVPSWSAAAASRDASAASALPSSASSEAFWG